MNSRKFFVSVMCMFLGCISMMAQKSELHQRAESEDAKHNVANARSLYIRAFEGYVGKGQIDEGVACGVKATALYYKDNLYKEAFELLRRVDQQIDGSNAQASNKSALHYQTSKERMQMYVKLRKSDRAKEQMGFMENHVSRSGNESLRDDLLYQKAIFYYTFGQTAQGNAVFKEMASKLTAQKDYDKVDEVYQMLLASGRQSNNAGMLNQAYSSYMVWKDSVTAIKTAEEIDSLKQQIAKNEEIIADKDDSLSARQLTISGLIVLVVILAVVLVLGAMVLMRFIVLTRTQKKTIRLANESVARGGGPFGAVIVKDGEVIAGSSNSVTIDNDPTAHAEVNTIREACRRLGTFDLSGCTIYTSCEPCPMCLGAIYWARISRIFYGNTRKDARDIDFADDFIYEELDRPMADRTVPIVPLLRDEALQSFRLWHQKEDKTEY